MKPTGTRGLSLGMALLCGNQALSQTNQQLLKDGSISPLVFELLERQGACRASQLPAIDCGASKRRRND
jgi:hypothetical protein